MPWIEKIIIKHDSKIKHWHIFDIIKDENKIPYITDEDKEIQKKLRVKTNI